MHNEQDMCCCIAQGRHRLLAVLQRERQGHETFTE